MDHRLAVRLFVARDSVEDGRRVGTDDIGDLVAVLEQVECGHGAHTEFLGNIGYLIHIDFVEGHVGELFREFNKLGCDDLARTAPRSEGINDDETLGGVNGFPELFAGLDVVDTHFSVGGGEVSDWVEGRSVGMGESRGGSGKLHAGE